MHASQTSSADGIRFKDGTCTLCTHVRTFDAFKPAPMMESGGETLTAGDTEPPLFDTQSTSLAADEALAKSLNEVFGCIAVPHLGQKALVGDTHQC